MIRPGRVAFGVLVLALAVAGCGGGGSASSTASIAASVAPIVVASPSATAAVAQAPTPAATPTATITPTPTPSPAPTPTPSPVVSATPSATPAPTGLAGGEAAVRQYEDALVAGQYARAWAMIGPEIRATLPLAEFSTERKSFLRTAGTQYTLQVNPTGFSLSEWLQGTEFATSIDTAHAVLVRVQWTALADNNAGWELFVCNPTATGWQLYQVR